jgi:transposase
MGTKAAQTKSHTQKPLINITRLRPSADAYDYLGFDLVMDDNLPEPSVLLADRGYDSDRVRETMEARNVVPVIPMRKSRKLRVAVDRTLYRLRNLVERCFNKLKNARRVATRYDKTAESFLGFIDITSIRLWLRHLST